MILKILALLSFLALPFSAGLWYKSHSHAGQHRYDITLYQSVWVYLKDGLCGMEWLTMPTKTASRSEFHTRLGWDPLARRGALDVESRTNGSYRSTFIVFPLWIPNVGFMLVCCVPLIRGPMRRWWRVRRGLCTECGYNLTGNRSRRCPECGVHTRQGAS